MYVWRGTLRFSPQGTLRYSTLTTQSNTFTSQFESRIQSALAAQSSALGHAAEFASRCSRFSDKLSGSSRTKSAFSIAAIKSRFCERELTIDCRFRPQPSTTIVVPLRSSNSAPEDAVLYPTHVRACVEFVIWRAASGRSDTAVAPLVPFVEH